MPGLIVCVTVATGDQVEKEQKLFTMEAMKMETTVYADRADWSPEVLVQPGGRWRREICCCGLPTISRREPCPLLRAAGFMPAVPLHGGHKARRVKILR